MTNEEKLQSFQTITMEEARKKGNDELKAYTESVNQAFEEYKEMKEQQAQLTLKAEKDNLYREMNKAVSLEQIHIRHEYTKRYEELKSKLFVEVQNRLADYMDSPEYSKLLEKLIRKNKEYAGKEAITIYIDPADADRLTSLQAATGAMLTVSEYSFGGGIRAVLPERNVLIDDSFQTRLKEAMENFSFKGGNE